jgi:hypothetical protein
LRFYLLLLHISIYLAIWADFCLLVFGRIKSYKDFFENFTLFFGHMNFFRTFYIHTLFSIILRFFRTFKCFSDLNQSAPAKCCHSGLTAKNLASKYVWVIRWSGMLSGHADICSNFILKVKIFFVQTLPKRRSLSKVNPVKFYSILFKTANDPLFGNTFNALIF